MYMYSVDSWGSKKRVLAGGLDLPRKELFRGHIWAWSGLSAVSVLNVIRNRAAAVRPLVTVNAATCYIVKLYVKYTYKHARKSTVERQQAYTASKVIIF